MNYIAGNSLTQLNLTKAASARGRAFRPAVHSSDSRKVHLSGVGQAGRAGKGGDEHRILTLEDLPIALRIAAAARHREPETVMDAEPHCELAMKENGLIGGLVRVLSRGQERAVRP